MKLSPTTNANTIDGYLFYLGTENVLKALINQFDLHWTYVSVFLFLKLSNHIFLTSAYPGQFRPYNFDYKPYYFTRVYSISLKVLCDRGFIKKEKLGTYSFTPAGNSLYMSYVRLLDHKTRQPDPDRSPGDDHP